MVAIDLHHVVFAHVARGDGQKAGGFDFAQVGDEEEAVAVVDALGGAVEAVRVLEARALEGDGRVFAQLLALALDGDAAVHGRGRGLDVERCGLAEVVEPVEDALMFFGADHPVDLAAAGGHQEED